jgi:integrase
VTLSKTHRHGDPVSVVVPADRNRDLCLVRALSDLMLLAPKLRHVFTHRDGKPLSRQAVHNVLNGMWDEVPGMSARDLATLLAEEYPATVSFSTMRDRALLLVAFYTALRRSNLSALNWRDVTDHRDDGLAVLVRRSKTDQEGKGRTLWVPQAAQDGPLACPAEALRAWRRELERVLGRPVQDSDPVFVALTSSGALKATPSGRPKRLTGDAINEVIQRLAVASGLTEKPRKGEKNPYGAHSTRAGFVTEATRDDKLSIIEVMEVTGHTSAEMVARYRREANAPKRNASRKLMQVLSS